MEDIFNADYTHAKKNVCKDFDKKKFHDLYVPSDTLLLADVFKNFRNICLEIYKHDLAKLLSAPGLV